MKNPHFIVMSISNNCRGWEGNETQIIKTTKSLYEYIVSDILSDYDVESLSEVDDVISLYKGLTPTTSKVNFEGDESCISYMVVDNLESLVEDDSEE